MELFVRLETVPNKWFGQQEFRLPRGSLDLFSQSVNKDTQVFSFVYMFGAPNFPQQFAVGDRPVTVSSKIEEQVKFL